MRRTRRRSATLQILREIRLSTSIGSHDPRARENPPVAAPRRRRGDRRLAGEPRGPRRNCEPVFEHRPAAARRCACTDAGRQPRQGVELARADREPRVRSRCALSKGDVVVFRGRISRRRRAVLREHRRDPRVPQPALAWRPWRRLRSFGRDAERGRLDGRLPAGTDRHRATGARPELAGPARPRRAAVRRDGRRPAGGVPRAERAAQTNPGPAA